MKYRDEKLRQMLSAEYVLGTLRGAARRRFQRLLREDRALRREVAWWEGRLAGFHDRIATQAPREIVWAGIEQRLRAQKIATLPAAIPITADRRPLRFWRGWALAASVASLFLAYGLWRQLDAGPQIIERVQTVRVEVPVAQPMPYVAMLQPNAPAQWMVVVVPDRRMLKIASSGAYPLDALNQDLQLWVLDDAGEPHALAVIPASGIIEMPLPMEHMPEKPVMAVSLEPKGGSPTGKPTGPVLTTAPLLQL